MLPLHWFVVLLLVAFAVLVGCWFASARRYHFGHPQASNQTTPSSGGMKWSQIAVWILVGIPAAFVSIGCSGCIVRDWTLPQVFGVTQAEQATEVRVNSTTEQGLDLRGQWESWSPRLTRTPGSSGYGIGFIYPPNYLWRTATTYTGVRGEAYLVSGQEYPSPPSLETARSIANSRSDGDDVRTTLYRLQADEKGEVHTSTWNDAPTMSVMYLLTAEPEQIHVGYQQHRFKQWLVWLDDRNDASFQVPENWECLWVIPLRSAEHLPQFSGLTISPEGVSEAELEAALSPDAVAALLKDSVPGIAYRGLYWSIGDEPASPLLDPVVWHHSELVAGTRVTLGINVAPGDTPDRPAGVLIGIQD